MSYLDRLRAKPNPEPEMPQVQVPTGPRVHATLWMGNGSTVEINGDLESFEVQNDFIDATTFGDAKPTYLTGRRKFVIRGFA